MFLVVCVCVLYIHGYVEHNHDILRRLIMLTFDGMHLLNTHQDF